MPSLNDEERRLVELLQEVVGDKASNGGPYTHTIENPSLPTVTIWTKGKKMDEERTTRWVGTLIVLGCLCLVLALIFGVIFGFKAIDRYQARADAKNQITINQSKIEQTKQMVEVEKQEAEVRKAEANGIAAAQQIINATLTDKYLMHEAIQAQMTMANSPNHTTIYIPVGDNGIPLVATVDDKTDPITVAPTK